MRVFGMVLLSLATWSMYIICAVVLILIGLIIVPFAAEFGLYETRESKYWPGRNIVTWKWKWMWLWGNEEDGIDGRRAGLDEHAAPEQMWWMEESKTDSIEERIAYWAAIRNPVSNMRFVWPFGYRFKLLKGANPNIWWRGNSLAPDVSYADAKRTAGLQPTFWFFAQDGWHTAFWIIYRGYQLRLGWKIVPVDMFGIDPDDYRLKGCDFALQLQKK